MVEIILIVYMLKLMNLLIKLINDNLNIIGCQCLIQDARLESDAIFLIVRCGVDAMSTLPWVQGQSFWNVELPKHMIHLGSFVYACDFKLLMRLFEWKKHSTIFLKLIWYFNWVWFWFHEFGWVNLACPKWVY